MDDDVSTSAPSPTRVVLTTHRLAQRPDTEVALSGQHQAWYGGYWNAMD
jgi:hypothetical protein